MNIRFVIFLKIPLAVWVSREHWILIGRVSLFVLSAVAVMNPTATRSCPRVARGTRREILHVQVEFSRTDPTDMVPFLALDHTRKVFVQNKLSGVRLPRTFIAITKYDLEFEIDVKF